MRFEFISYDGKFPHLCSGTLKFTDTITNKTYSIKGGIKSTGTCDYLTDTIMRGDWKINWAFPQCPDYGFPTELSEFEDELTTLINNNIPHGCCGGCI